jgi:hypothetical protein
LTQIEFLGTDGITWLRLGLWLALSACLWVVWYGSLVSRGARPLYAAIGAQLFSLAQIILSEMALGFTGVLFASWIVVVNLVLCAIPFFFLIWPNRSKLIADHRRWFASWRATKKPVDGFFLFSLFLGITMWNVFWGWFFPPRDWDSLAYHLPIMAAFYQAHAIYPIQVPSVWVRYYPINGELLNLWALALVGIDKVIDLAFVPAYLAGTAAVYGLARQFGARRTFALCGVCVFGLAPGMLIQQVGTLNDALFASLIAMGLFMAIASPDTSDGRRPVFFWMSALGAAIASGLLVGLKFSGAVYGLGIWIVFCAKWLIPQKQSTGIYKRTWISAIITSSLLMICLGGYSYIRNWIHDGNPLAPFEVRVGETVLWPGAKDMSDFVDWSTSSNLAGLNNIAKTVTVWFEPYSTVYDEGLSGLGGLWVVLAVPSILLWTLRCIRRRRRLDLALTAVLLLGFAITPVYWLPRYVFSILILGGIATALVLEEAGPWTRRIVTWEILFLAAFSVFNVLAPYRITAEKALRVLTVENDQSRSSPQFIISVDGGHAFEWIDQHTSQTPAVIMYGKQVIYTYPLYGDDLRNTVDLFLPHSEADWRSEIARVHADIVIVSQGTSNYSWMAGMPEYQQVFQEGDYAVFQRK